MNTNVKLLSDPGYMPGPRFPITQYDDRAPDDIEDIEFFLGRKGALEKKGLPLFVIQHAVRRTLPYGIWTCADGREVLFNREYQPIAQRKDGVVSYANRDENVGDIVHAEMLYDDLTSPVDYVCKHLGYRSMDAHESRACRKALLNCLAVLKDFTPKEHDSVNSAWSVRHG